MTWLAGRVAIVTGAGRGLGRAHALALAAAGAGVVVNDAGCTVDGEGEDVTVADAVVAEIRIAGGAAVASSVAVGTEDAADALVRAATEAFGRLDVLVNNAGITRSAAFPDFALADWDRVLAVNLTGTFLCARAAFAAMRGTGGRIVNTTSGAGLLTGHPRTAAYAASKAGVAALTRVIAAEGAPFGITCNAIAPLARTRMSGDFLAGRGDADTPDAAAALVVYLASAASAHVTGEVFRVREGRIGTVRPGASDGIGPRGDAWSVDEIAARIGEVLASRP